MLLAAHSIAEKDSGFPIRFALSTVAPGQTSGVLRFASSILHILPQTTGTHESIVPDARGRKAAQEYFSEESFRTQTQPGNVFLKSSTTDSAVLAKNSWLTTSLD